MKVINKEDLIMLLNNIDNQDSFTLTDIEFLFDSFGDDWFFEDFKFTCTTINQRMVKARQELKKE